MKLRLYSILFLALLTASCANRGIGPQGGPKDTIPPVPLKSDPVNGAVDFHGKRIEISFNEYLQLSDLGSNLLISPPQKSAPDVKARSKRVVVQFQDTLRDSTTYTIDFGSAICDYTEKNPIKGYSFAFSTGPTIDTLVVYGRVFDALTLNPLSGICAGIHANLADSAFSRETFLRIAKTDSAGYFRIGNIHQGRYRLYAVDDISRDYCLTPGEACAFQDSVLSITQPIASQPDTTDSIISPKFEIINLFLFKEEQPRLYLQRTLREEPHKIQLLFSSRPDSLPQIRSLTDSISYVTEFSRYKDTVSLWLTDSLSIFNDSIFLEARYRRTDSLFHLEWYTDTLRAIFRKPRMSATQRETKGLQLKNRRLEIKTNGRKGFDVYDTLRLAFGAPLAVLHLDSMHLVERVENGGEKPISFTVMPYDTLPMVLTILADFKPGGKYDLKLDSATFTDVYGTTHIAASYGIEVKKIEDYATLRVKLEPFVPKARLQLLNTKDQVILDCPAVEGEGTLFEYLKPGDYYLRMYIDENGDGKWTTGSWEHKRQPELVYYFPNKVNTRANWDFEEVWNYEAVERTKAKPVELIKAAPQKKK